MKITEVIKSKNQLLIKLGLIDTKFNTAYGRVISLAKLLKSNPSAFSPQQLAQLVSSLSIQTTDLLNKADKFLNMEFIPDRDIRRMKKNTKRMKENVIRLLQSLT